MLTLKDKIENKIFNSFVEEKKIIDFYKSDAFKLAFKSLIHRTLSQDEPCSVHSFYRNKEKEKLTFDVNFRYRLNLKKQVRGCVGNELVYVTFNKIMQPVYDDFVIQYGFKDCNVFLYDDLTDIEFRFSLRVESDLITSLNVPAKVITLITNELPKIYSFVKDKDEQKSKSKIPSDSITNHQVEIVSKYIIEWLDNEDFEDSRINYDVRNFPKTNAHINQLFRIMELITDEDVRRSYKNNDEYHKKFIYLLRDTVWLYLLEQNLDESSVYICGEENYDRVIGIYLNLTLDL